jgi:hypothetical protein
LAFSAGFKLEPRVILIPVISELYNSILLGDEVQHEPLSDVSKIIVMMIRSAEEYFNEYKITRWVNASDLVGPGPSLQTPGVV